MGALVDVGVEVRVGVEQSCLLDGSFLARQDLVWFGLNMLVLMWVSEEIKPLSPMIPLWTQI